MDIKSRLDYIKDKSDLLTDENNKTIARVCLELKANLEADSETHEELKNLKYTNSDLIKERLQLAQLKESLFFYKNRLGIQKSLLSLDDIITLIQKDIDRLNDSISNNKDSESIIKTLLDK